MSKALKLLVCCIALFTSGCIEYRLRYEGHKDIYIGGLKTKRNLDPKLGSRGKIYLTNNKDIRLYFGGDLRRGSARFNPGIIHYFNNYQSIEIGYRVSIFDVRFLQRRNRGSRRLNPFRDAKNLFYIGGVVIF